jgi:hypothetical protein
METWKEWVEMAVGQPGPGQKAKSSIRGEFLSQMEIEERMAVGGKM